MEKKYWKRLKWIQRLGGMASQGITWVGKTVVARLMETQTWCLPATLRGKGS